MLNTRNNIWGGFVNKDSSSTIMKSDPTYMQQLSNKRSSKSYKAMKRWVVQRVRD